MVVVAAAYGLVVVRHLALAQLDPSAFVLAGPPYTDATRAPAALRMGATGYDGQFYYRLALDPFAVGPTAHGITFDAPAYRYQRIGYPAIVWLLSAGQPGLVPALLIAVNYVGIGVVALLAARGAAFLGRSAWWGAAVPFYPGFVYTITRDLTEIVAAAFLLGGVLALWRGRSVAAGLLLAAAVLTRETTLLLPCAGLVVALRARWSAGGAARVVPWRPFAMAILVYLAWQLAMVFIWGVPAAVAGGGTLGPPFQGLGGLVRDASRLSTTIRWVWSAELLFLAGFGALVAASLRATRAGPAIAAAWGLYAGLAVFYSGSVWEGDTAFLRALTELFVLGWLCLLGKPGPGRTAIAGGLLGCTCGLWLVVATLVR